MERKRIAAIAAGVVIVGFAAAWLGGACGGSHPAAESPAPYASASASAGSSSSAAPSASAAASASSTPGADADVDAARAGDASDAGDAGDAGEEAGAHHHAGRTVTIDESSAGKTIDLGFDTKLVVSLTASPNNGYDWFVAKAPAALGKPEMSFVPGGEGLGAAGHRRLTFTPKQLPPGEHEVELVYQRSFEPGKPAFKKFDFKVRPVKE